MDAADYTDESDQEECGVEYNGEENVREDIDSEAHGDSEDSIEADDQNECEGSNKDDYVGRD